MWHINDNREFSYRHKAKLFRRVADRLPESEQRDRFYEIALKWDRRADAVTWKAGD